jgi:hypothetical protein
LVIKVVSRIRRGSDEPSHQPCVPTKSSTGLVLAGAVHLDEARLLET